jgi:hypothetical protein
VWDTSFNPGRNLSICTTEKIAHVCM